MEILEALRNTMTVAGNAYMVGSVVAALFIMAVTFVSELLD